MGRFHLSPRLVNPLFWHLLPLLRDPKIRYIYVEGGSSAAKTFSICQALAYDMMQHQYSAMVFRRFQINLADSVYASFRAGCNSLGVEGQWLFQQLLIKAAFAPGVRLRFRGLDDPETVKGIEEYNVVYNNEWNQFSEEQWDQQRKRLRGRVNQKFICDWNPVSAKLWLYERWIDKDTWIDLPLSVPDAPTKWSALDPDYSFKRINAAGDSVWIKTTFRDNYWIVGRPDGKAGFVDTHTLADFERDRIHKPGLYRIYANGERGILRTGGEFWKQFSEDKHVKPATYVPAPVHVVVDENVNPYVPVAIWQVNGKAARQIHEICAKTPENNAPKAARLVIKYLQSIGHADKIFFYGDTTAGKRSTVDENSKSFLQKFMEELEKGGYRVTSRVGRGNPRVSLSADFVNEIFEGGNAQGWQITISDTCKVSIDDYATVKEDAEGGMAKPEIKDPITKIKYQPYGHFSDCLRYFITQMLAEDFALWVKRRKPGAITGLGMF